MKENLKKISIILLFVLFVLSGLCLIASCDLKTKITTNNKLASASAPKMLNQDVKSGYLISDNIITDEIYSNGSWSSYYTDSIYGRYYQYTNYITLPKGRYYFVYSADSLTNLKYVDELYFNGIPTGLSGFYYQATKHEITSTNKAYSSAMRDFDSAQTGVGGSMLSDDSNGVAYWLKNSNSSYLGNNTDVFTFSFRVYSGSTSNNPNLNAFHWGIYKVVDLNDLTYNDNRQRLECDVNVYYKRLRHVLDVNFFADNSTFKYAPLTDESAYMSGYNQAKENFKSDLYNEYVRGYNNGKTEGSQDAYIQGENAGYSRGYNVGYEYGLSLSENASLGEMVESVADVPLNVMYNLFNLDILGVNLWVFITSILTLLIVIFVIKKFIK